MKKLVAAVFALGATLLITSTVMADTVTRTPSPVMSPAVFHGLCSFDVLAVALSNNEYTTTFVNQDGVIVKQIITGSLVVNFTNMSTGKSTTQNISGPGKVTFNPDGSVTIDIMGREFGFPGDSLGSGRTVIDISPAGVGTVVSRQGSYQSLCSLLS